MAVGTSEIFIKGGWVRVPALEIDDETIVIKGGWLRIASVRNEAWLETELRDPELCIEQLKIHRPDRGRADIFTFAQKLPATIPKYSYPTEWDSIAAIRLTTFQAWWEKLPQATRKNVRRSEKRGVVVTVRQFDDDLIRGLVELNNDCPMRQGVRNVQYGKTFDQVRKDHSSFLDRSDLICAYLGSELIGFLKIVYRGGVASILNLLSKARHNEKRPANALVAKAIELCAARGISYVTYGMFNYGNKRESPLREFKIRNGFGEILVPRFYVPLTRWGTLCMKLKLHRGLLGILPHGVIALVIGARTKWHSLKQSNEPV
jgi:Acetyltransferase (GNAT) domain